MRIKINKREVYGKNWVMKKKKNSNQVNGEPEMLTQVREYTKEGIHMCSLCVCVCLSLHFCIAAKKSSELDFCQRNGSNAPSWIFYNTR